jgi:hypothetical protein
MNTRIVRAIVPGGKMPPSTAGREARRYFSDTLLKRTGQQLEPQWLKGVTQQIE